MIPNDLKHDATVRGPYGTVLAGVSVAIPLKETLDDVTQLPWSEETWREFITISAPTIAEALKKHVGGARFQAEPQFSVDGPNPDPLMGAVYVMTLAAWFRPEDFPLDCEAYRAHHQQAQS